MYYLERVWIEFRKSIGDVGNYVYLFRLSSDRVSNNKNKFVVILKKLIRRL